LWLVGGRFSPSLTHNTAENADDADSNAAAFLALGCQSLAIDASLAATKSFYIGRGGSLGNDGSPCDPIIQPEAVAQSRRPGFAVSQISGSGSGLHRSANDPISSPGPQTPFAADYRLRAPAIGPSTNSRKSGDRLTVKLNRDGVSDGCGNYPGIEDVLIRYTTQWRPRVAERTFISGSPRAARRRVA
jgi:hypothetical protein